jgi:hypothetical protein
MHSISVFLLKKEEIRNEKIESLSGDKTLRKIKFTEMGEGILATTEIPNFKEFRKGKIIALVETDYFGGGGDQSAKLYVDGVKMYDESDVFDYSKTPINDVLKMMGVVKKTGMDEFDTIGLGKYRTNEDFEV